MKVQYCKKIVKEELAGSKWVQVTWQWFDPLFPQVRNFIATLLLVKF